MHGVHEVYRQFDTVSVGTYQRKDLLNLRKKIRNKNYTLNKGDLVFNDKSIFKRIIIKGGFNLSFAFFLLCYFASFLNSLRFFGFFSIFLFYLFCFLSFLIVSLSYFLLTFLRYRIFLFF